MLPAGVLGVHELRYLLAYGAHAGRALTDHGDSYVGTANLLAGVLLVLPAAALAVGVIGARRGRAAGRPAALGPWQTWLAWTTLLIVGFCATEAVEMVFESAHPDGLAGVFGGGGWWALPAAVAVAALFTLITRGARALVRRVAARQSGGDRWGPAPTSLSSTRPVRLGRTPGLAPLADRAAGRAPPSRPSLARPSR